MGSYVPNNAGKHSSNFPHMITDEGRTQHFQRLAIPRCSVSHVNIMDGMHRTPTGVLLPCVRNHDVVKRRMGLAKPCQPNLNGHSAYCSLFSTNPPRTNGIDDGDNGRRLLSSFATPKSSARQIGF